MASLSRLQLTRKIRIVDVGCGTGFLLYFLKEAGFENVMGVEPNIEKDIEYSNGLTIKKAWIHELDEEQDVVMFHHSFEHLPNPIETLERVYRLLPDSSSSGLFRSLGKIWNQLGAIGCAATLLFIFH